MGFVLRFHRVRKTGRIRVVVIGRILRSDIGFKGFKGQDWVLGIGLLYDNTKMHR